MQCPRCQTENPPQAKFCLECATPLLRRCVNCGTELPVAAKFCPECALPVAAPGTTQSRFAAPDSYTPKHLAEKILTSKAALEGERKQVTVLFADLKGSMELLADRDPEEARKLLDPVLEHMMEAVHRYEGTVNQVMGDGIMALFGAPLAHEDHAVRACYAALYMQDSVKRYADGVLREHGVTIRVRVGLNSGDVVVRAIGSDLHMDYTAVGQTTHLAARMEQLADPGSVLVAPDTLALAEGFVRVTSLGPLSVKGLSALVEVYELIGVSAIRSRLQAAATRGLSRFVGRHTELAILHQALEKAQASHGQVVAVIGEPGVGKSRLVSEFAYSFREDGALVLEAAAVPYGQAMAYLPLIGLLRAYFQLNDLDDAVTIRTKISGRLTGLDESLVPALPAFLSLLDVPLDDRDWQRLDPLQRRQRLLEACTRLLRRESQVQPLILLFEDLHWIDPETQALLDNLVDGLPTTRTLLIISYRHEYKHGWANKTYYTQVRVDPLPAASAQDLLDAILGDDATLKPVKRLLIDRTDGNPFFLEENVRALVESRILLGERGAYRAAKVLDTVRVPPTIHAVLASRIDRLSPEVKGVLQTAAVIGKDVEFDLLLAVADLPEPLLRQALDRLQTAEVVYETSSYPEREYTFKHALTHEVAYGSLLHDRRRSLHARILTTLEQRYAGRLTEQVERLSHHARRAELWDRAATYFREAARKAMRRGAYRGAVACLEQALAAVEHQPQTHALLQQTVDLRFLLRHSLTVFGDVTRIHDQLRAAEAILRELDDPRRLAKLSTYMTQYFWSVSEHDKAIEVGEQAIAQAGGLGDAALWLEARLYVGSAHFSRGDYGSANRILTENADALAEVDSREARLLASISNCYLAMSLGFLGRFVEASARSDNALRIAERTEHPFQLVWASFGIATLAFLKGQMMDVAIPVLERGMRLCETTEMQDLALLVAAFLGYAYARARRIADGLRLLDWFVVHAGAQVRVMHYSHVGFIAAEGYVLAGRPEAAIQVARKSLEVAREHQERGFEAFAHHVLGEIAAKREPLEAETTANDYREAMSCAAKLGMRPLVAHCHLGLGKLSRRTDRQEQAQEHLTTAATMYREMDMQFWLEQAETEMRELA